MALHDSELTISSSPNFLQKFADSHNFSLAPIQTLVKHLDHNLL